MRLAGPIPRSGYTLGEVIIVVVIIGILSAVSLPRLGRVRDQGQLNGATVRFTRAVMAARQAAIQRGKPAYFKHNDSWVWVIVDTTGTNADSVLVTSALSLDSLYGVEVTSPTGLTTIEYDPRGISTQAAKQTFHFKHRSNRQDSLCVSRLGNTIRVECP